MPFQSKHYLSTITFKVKRQVYHWTGTVLRVPEYRNFCKYTRAKLNLSGSASNFIIKFIKRPRKVGLIRIIRISQEGDQYERSTTMRRTNLQWEGMGQVQISGMVFAKKLRSDS